MRFAGLERGFSEKFHCYNAPFSLLQRGGIPTISLLQRTLIKMSCNQQLRTTMIKKSVGIAINTRFRLTQLDWNEISAKNFTESAPLL